jgi:hypothetical protein
VRSWVLVLAVVALAAAGCGGSESARSPLPLSDDELTWVRAYSVWTIDMYDEELGSAPGPALVRKCRERLRALGDAPTKRLRPAAKRAGAACAFLVHEGSYRRALDVIDDADDRVLPYLRDSQDLPLTAGATSISRADLRLSALASELADTQVEVRCWSDSDWRRVVGERNAWNDYDSDVEDLYGWQDEDNSRIHIRLSQCNQLARLRGADVLEASHDEQLEAADSLDTFAHEVQHFVLPDEEEAAVQCAAVAELQRTAELLGASASEAALLARVDRTEIYPELPTEYVMRGGCKR